MYKVMLADDEGIVIDSLKLLSKRAFRGSVRLHLQRPEEA